MSHDLPPDTTSKPLPGEQEALEARMLSDELQAHWRDPAGSRLRPIALAAASGLLRQYADMPLLDPALLKSLERSQRAMPKPMGMFDELERNVQALRVSYHRPGRREAAMDVATTAYRIATEGDAGGNVGNVKPSSPEASGVPTARQLARLEAIIEAARTPSQLQLAWKERPDEMRECLYELRQLVTNARIHLAGQAIDRDQAA